MKHVKTFEQFESNDTESVNEELKLFGRELKFWPSYNDQLKRRLSFLAKTNLDEIKVGSQQREIKDLMLRVDKATKLSSNSMKDNIESAEVQEVDSMLKAMKELKADVVSKDESKGIGFISYFPEVHKFYYSGSLINRK